MSVDSNFLAVMQRVQERRPLAVTHGVPLRHDEVTPGTRPVVLDTDDPVTILFEFMRQKNLRLIDLLHSLDKDNSDTLTRDELRNGLLVRDVFFLLFFFLVNDCISLFSQTHKQRKQTQTKETNTQRQCRGNFRETGIRIQDFPSA